MPELVDELAVALRHSDDPFDAAAAAAVIRSDLGTQTGREALSGWFAEAPAVDVADALDELSEEELHRALPLIPVEVQPDVVGYLPLERQAELAAGMPQSALITLLENMSSDERADLFNALPEDRDKLLPALSSA